MAVCMDFDLCIEVTDDPDDKNTILIRETAEPTVIVKTSRANWEAFVAGVKNGDFDNV